MDIWSKKGWSNYLLNPRNIPWLRTLLPLCRCIWCSELCNVMWSLFQGNQQNRINQYEAQIFWVALILCPLLWGVFFFIGLFRLNFKWLVSTRKRGNISGECTHCILHIVIILSHMELLPLTDSIVWMSLSCSPKLNSEQLTFPKLVLKSVLSCLTDGYELEDWGTVFQ